MQRAHEVAAELVGGAHDEAVEAAPLEDLEGDGGGVAQVLVEQG